MIRTVTTANKNILSFKIPDKYIGKLIEIIAFAIDVPFDESIISKTIKKHIQL